MAVAVVNSQMVLNANTVITDNAATSSVVDATEVFTFTPTKPEYKVFMEIEVGPTHGTVAFSIAAGQFWAAGNPLTGSTAQTVKTGIVLEGAKYKKNDGTIVVTFTPAAGKRLFTDHALKVRFIQLP